MGSFFSYQPTSIQSIEYKLAESNELVNSTKLHVVMTKYTSAIEYFKNKKLNDPSFLLLSRYRTFC